MLGHFSNEIVWITEGELHFMMVFKVLKNIKFQTMKDGQTWGMQRAIVCNSDENKIDIFIIKNAKDF